MEAGDRVFRYLFFSAGLTCALAGLMVLGFMVVLGFPLIRSGMLWEILTDPWSPDHGQFGILAMAVSSVYIAGLSLVIAFPVSLGASLFIEVVRPRGGGRMLERLVRLMTAIPTVIYGFVGIFLLVPLVRSFSGQGSGLCILTAALMLSVLIAPTMILFFSRSIARVPRSWLDAVDAMGGTPYQKVRHVIFPAAWPGILSGTVLAFGRAVGDTLIALMLGGNAVTLPGSLLDSARTLTAHIALVIAADFDSVEFKTIFISGILLYAMTGLGILAARAAEKHP